ncbi:PREDICTED: uncharacterized protein LOC108566460 [Nicrophorus vespilloides]|uniref:Uncharacterized protein LOC108566460 n=1 Tax=Nicrophorus vespilloides TaxID=110193 RepID=A0ABM1N4T7_NICVS|nr:PREDICTED: uncharacterized protein LOC108566460 [Nicrophorus vespilloides]
MEWSIQKTLQLIEQYHLKPILWDSSNCFYKQYNKREEEWTSLADIFSTSPSEIKRKINSLLASYRRERIKLQSTTGEDTSRWFAFKELHFLKDKYTPRKMTNMEDEEHYVNPDMVKIEEVLFTEEMDEDVDEPKQTESNENYAYTSEKKQSSDGNVHDENIAPPKFFKRIRARPVKDEYDVYGELIAHEIRKLPRRDQYRVKHSINNIIYEAHMNEQSPDNAIQYSSPNSSSSSVSPQGQSSQVTTSQN